MNIAQSVGNPDSTVSLDDIGPDQFEMRISTERYTSADFAARERADIWMKVWQIVGRHDELTNPGDWKLYRIFDQSYIVVRGRDGKIRGFVNACRHRGNALCHDSSGNAKRGFLCQYHLWSYDLEGRLKGVLRDAVVGPVDKANHGLIEVPVATFAGFIFLNPDRKAQPLTDFIDERMATLLAPYRIDEMVTVMDVSERIECNWKIVLDAFLEAYHTNAIHPQFLKAITIDPASTRYRFFGSHSMSMAPFNVVGVTAQQQVDAVKELPATLPTTAAALPRFEELVADYRRSDGSVEFPDGVNARMLLQQATRDTWTRNGFDVSDLRDDQMIDNHGWVLFPNIFMAVRAGEASIVTALPDPDGDPNRCIWRVAAYMWLPEEYRNTFTAEPIVVEEPGSYEYALLLQQDYEQMPRQQVGLRNTTLEHMALVKEEVLIAHFHSVLDRNLAAAATA